MDVAGWTWKGLLALAGCIAGAYVGQELMGGRVTGWVATAAIVAAACSPLFQAIIKWRNAR